MKIASKVLGLLLASALALASGASSAQSYPSKPIRFVTGNQAGGGVSLSGTTPAELGALQQADITKWTRIMKELNVRAQ